jgi:predicted negative regulator of RcsB-dependent stress response
MAALDLQEQEQLDTLKAWWKENGNLILGVVLVAAVAFAGWRGWQYYQHKQASEAATLYGAFMQQMDGNDIKRVNDAAAAVMDKYSSTSYAAQAALAAAQANLVSRDMARVKTLLQWVVDHSGEAALRDVARLRLAAVLLDEAKYEDALKLLDASHTSSFDGLYADLKGDVLNAQGKNAEARAAYKLAYDKTDAKSMYRNLIQMKMDAIGETK